MNNYFNAKLKIFNLQNKNDYAIINKQFRKNFIKKKFLGKLIIPKNNDYQKIKFKIKNEYLLSKINDENMSFVYAFAKLLAIKNKSFINSMNSFEGLSHRF